MLDNVNPGIFFCLGRGDHSKSVLPLGFYGSPLSCLKVKGGS